MHPNSVYYVQDSLNGKPRVFYDPNVRSLLKTYLSEIIFSGDGQLAALKLNKGSDWTFVRFRNTTSGENFPETLHNIKFSEIVWSNDGLGVFYAVTKKIIET